MAREALGCKILVVTLITVHVLTSITSMAVPATAIKLASLLMATFPNFCFNFRDL
jgi:hypothetical protein